MYAAAVLVTLLTGCGSVTGTQVPVPTFPSDATGAAGGTQAVDEGLVPDDCTRVLPPDVVEAVLGLPLGTVTVRTTMHQPAPSVGRTERVVCRYTRTGTGGGGPLLLSVDVSAYRDADAALAQWRLNAGVEEGDGRELQLGSARGVLVDRRGEKVLLVANARANLTFVLAQGASKAERSPEDTLVDLALRAIPAVPAAAAASNAESAAPASETTSMGPNAAASPTVPLHGGVTTTA